MRLADDALSARSAHMLHRVMVVTLGFLLALASLFAQPNEAAKQFHQVAAADTEYRRVTFPEGATLQGDHRFNNRWNDYSLRRRDAAASHAKQILARLDAIDTTQLNEQDALSHQLLRRQSALQLESHQFPEDYLVLDQMRGRHLTTPNVLQTMPRRTVADFETILVRLDALPVVLKQWEELLREGLTKGVTPPQAAIAELPHQVLEQVAGADALAAPLMVPFTSIPNTVPKEAADLLRQRANRVFTEKVKPAYEAFHRFLADTYLPRARRTNGFSDLPNGAAWYALELRRHTTTNLTPRELHDYAMREIDELVSQMQAA